jgi:hypothetical protein
VRIHRDLYAWIVLGATLVGAVWLYTYRVWSVVEYIQYSRFGPTKYHFHRSDRVRMQPWWSVYAAVALMLIGAAVVVWLLPEQKRKRLIRRFAKIVSPVPSS